MKNVFISQPMYGKTDEQIIRERKEIVKTLEEILTEPFKIVDNYYTDYNSGTNPLSYLSRAINDLSKADVAVFAKGWNTRRGCRIEHACAEEYGINIIELNDTIEGKSLGESLTDFNLIKRQRGKKNFEEIDEWVKKHYLFFNNDKKE